MTSQALTTVKMAAGVKIKAAVTVSSSCFYILLNN